LSSEEEMVLPERKEYQMKTVTATRTRRVEADAEFKAMGVVAFEVVKFVVNFYGNEIETEHDTKIMEDGRQIVIGGCGFIPEGYEVK
jgi:hypothetical protein